MLEGRDFRHLSSLRISRLYSVALITTVAGVIPMAKNDLWAVLRRQCSDVIRELVAHTTGIVLFRRYIFVFRVMAIITSRMCLKAGFYCHAASGRIMASRTALGRLAGAAVMITMVKNRIEALFKVYGKCLDRWIVGV